MKDHGTVLLIDDPPAASSGKAGRYVVIGDSVEELAHATFATIADTVGSKAARELWKAVAKGSRGRPSRAIVDKDARLLPGIRKFERLMPGASVTATVRAFVLDAAARGISLGISEDAAVDRLVRYRKLRTNQGVLRGDQTGN